MKSVNELKAPLSAIFTPLIGEFRIKTYFSYYGIFKDKIMLALYKDEQLYLRIAKTDLEEIKLLPKVTRRKWRFFKKLTKLSIK